MDQKILTADQVAQVLQVHPFTVLKFIKQGKLRASKLGRVYRIRESDVTKFLDEQEAATASKSKQPTHKEADEQTVPDKNQMTLPTAPAIKAGSSKEPKDQEGSNLMEAESTIPKPKKESVHSVSRKQQEQQTPNNTGTDEMDHYILD